MSKKTNQSTGPTPNIQGYTKVGDIKEHMKYSYLDYAYSVIVGRALPDVRDGLKPVARRIIYTCYENKFFYNNPYRKSARIVGDVMGKYHPHGDQSIYMTLVRMAQDFSLRYPLIDGQGNFGSIDGDPPAAQRYTEARLARIAGEMIADIDKETVDFIPNYDESLEEPVYLPSKLPILLMNGTSGIAVGMRTNMPPYNLRELVAGIKAVIDNPNILPEEINKYIKGPDFPSGGIILGKRGVRHILNTGTGQFTLRGKIEYEESDKKNRLVITEIPYQVNKAKLVENIADLMNQKKITGISDLRDESSRKGIRIVMDLGRDADPNLIKNILFKNTNLETSFSAINLVLINKGKKPDVLNMKSLIRSFIDCREEVIIKRTQYELKVAQKRLHIIEGLLIAIKNIDEIIKIIKASQDIDDARTSLMAKYSFSEPQATEILNMPLRRLTSLQTQKLKEEEHQLEQDVKNYQDILARKEKRMEIIKSELDEMEQLYGDDRKTDIIDVEEESDEDEILKTIPEETCVVMLTQNQYIKRMKLEEYQAQRRGGKGKKGISIREEDIIEDVFVVSSHDKLLLLTKKGRVYCKSAYELPLMTRTAKGKALINFVGMRPDEKITQVIPVSDFKQGGSLIFASRKGITKKTELSEFKNVRKTGVLAIKLREDDELQRVLLSEAGVENQILIATKNGYAIRFPESELRDMGRSAMGVRGIRLRENDEVVDMILGNPETDVVTITNQGYGKRSKLSLYRETRRGGKGVININFHEENDFVCAVKSVYDEDLLIATNSGIMIRIPSVSLRSLSRSAMGVRVIKMEETDSVRSVALCESDECEESLESSESPESSESSESSGSSESSEQDSKTNNNSYSDSKPNPESQLDSTEIENEVFGEELNSSSSDEKVDTQKPIESEIEDSQEIEKRIPTSNGSNRSKSKGKSTKSKKN